MFSPVKLVILILVALGVWAGYKWVSGLGNRGTDNDRVGRGKSGKVRRGAGSDTVQDLVKCPDCGMYVASLDDHTCSG